MACIPRCLYAHSPLRTLSCEASSISTEEIDAHVSGREGDGEYGVPMYWCQQYTVKTAKPAPPSSRGSVCVATCSVNIHPPECTQTTVRR